jgi:hypothetical protein
MNCLTPTIQAPNTTEDIVIDFKLGFNLDGNTNYSVINKTVHNIDDHFFAYLDLPPIKRQDYVHDEKKNESQGIEVKSWN